MEKSSVGSQSRQNIKAKTETQGKFFRESKSSKYQPQNRDTREILQGIKVVKMSTQKTETHGKKFC